jgi:hypothetical protein
VGAWRCSSTHFNLGTRWRWVVSFMPPPLCTQYQRDRRLGGSERGGRMAWRTVCVFVCSDLVPRVFRLLNVLLNDVIRIRCLKLIFRGAFQYWGKGWWLSRTRLGHRLRSQLKFDSTETRWNIPLGMNFGEHVYRRFHFSVFPAPREHTEGGTV